MIHNHGIIKLWIHFLPENIHCEKSKTFLQFEPRYQRFFCFLHYVLQHCGVPVVCCSYRVPIISFVYIFYNLDKGIPEICCIPYKYKKNKNFFYPVTASLLVTTFWVSSKSSGVSSWEDTLPVLYTVPVFIENFIYSPMLAYLQLHNMLI
jgi:hypothetical protein